MAAASLAQKELVFVRALRNRADRILARAQEPDLRAFVEVAAQDLEQALTCLDVERTAQSPTVLRAAIRLTNLALDRIATAETALREQGPAAMLRRSGAYTEI
jgi:hypothetical protein